MNEYYYVKPKNPRRKYWRCRDCKWHQTNITAEEIKNQHPNSFVQEPCDTDPNDIMEYVEDVLGHSCFEPLESLIEKE